MIPRIIGSTLCTYYYYLEDKPLKKSWPQDELSGHSNFMISINWTETHRQIGRRTTRETERQDIGKDITRDRGGNREGDTDIGREQQVKAQTGRQKQRQGIRKVHRVFLMTLEIIFESINENRFLHLSMIFSHFWSKNSKFQNACKRAPEKPLIFPMTIISYILKKL